MKLDDYLLFNDYKNTLHKLSYDSEHDEHMTDSDIKSVDFDEVKMNYCRMHQISEKSASSADALLQVSNRIAFIEFKNGNARKKKQEIKDKANESLMIFCDITNCHITETRTFLEFILVYNEERTNIGPNEMKAQAMAKLSHKPYKILDLDKHAGLCYKNILTLNRAEFNDWLHEDIGINEKVNK